MRGIHLIAQQSASKIKIHNYIKMKRKPDITSDFLFVCDCRKKFRQFFIFNKGAKNEKLLSVSSAVNGRENNIKIEKTGG